MDFRTRYNPAREGYNIDPSTWPPEGNMTQQHFKTECDINYIVANFVRSGTPPPPINPDDYQDVSDLSDYRDCLHRIRQADDDFSALPSATRKAFGNDPAEFLLFLSSDKTPEHVSHGIKLGIYNWHPSTGETSTSMARPDKEPIKKEPASQKSD